MEFKINKLDERKITPIEENENRRNYIIQNYQQFIPDIEEYIYERKNPTFNYSYLYKSHRDVLIQTKFNQLANIIVDIRNNTSPTNYYSNSINKTDNRYSNETKKLVKHLLGKGWTNNEIAYEMEKIYGSGIVTWYVGLEREPTLFSMILGSAAKLFSLYLCFRLGKVMIGKYKNKKMLKK